MHPDAGYVRPVSSSGPAQGVGTRRVVGRNMEIHAESSVDPVDAERYRQLAETWWDSSGPFWPLHRLNAFRVAYIRDRLAALAGGERDPRRPLQGLSVLDIGCGGGILSESLAGLGAQVLGIDVVRRNIEIARSHAARTGATVDYRFASAEELAGEDLRFDVVFNMEVVEHVAHVPPFMAACCRLVSPGGHMFVATINRTPAAFLAAIVGAEYVLRWLPRGTHQWRKFVTPREVSACLEAGDLKVLDRVGVRVNPFTRGFSLSDYLGVNYMILGQRPAAGCGP